MDIDSITMQVLGPVVSEDKKEIKVASKVSHNTNDILGSVSVKK
jgi:hypothetical protein